MFVRRRHRGRHANNTYASNVSRNQTKRKTSSSEEGYTLKRSRSRSINTQTDERDFKKATKSQKHSQAITPERTSPRNADPKVESKD